MNHGFMQMGGKLPETAKPSRPAAFLRGGANPVTRPGHPPSIPRNPVMNKPSIARRLICLAGLSGGGQRRRSTRRCSIGTTSTVEQTKIMDSLVADFRPEPGHHDQCAEHPVNLLRPPVHVDRRRQGAGRGDGQAGQPAAVDRDGALEPIDAQVAAWPGKADLGDKLLEINKGHDGKQYYLPLRCGDLPLPRRSVRESRAEAAGVLRTSSMHPKLTAAAAPGGAAIRLRHARRPRGQDAGARSC
jgi:hypothetical protein